MKGQYYFSDLLLFRSSTSNIKVLNNKKNPPMLGVRADGLCSLAITNISLEMYSNYLSHPVC
ncbi:MAG: hypothetical protein M3Z26_13030 [Bacteroidota bacterium]|nr:hypothetical protein [Bacteroidota bacterium]